MRRVAVGRQRRELRNKRAAAVEQLLGLVAAHPVLEQSQMRRVLAQLVDRNLMRAPKALDLLAVDLLRAGPALRAAQHDHRPARPLARSLRPSARMLLDRADAGRAPSSSASAMAWCISVGLVALDEQRLIAVAAKQAANFVVAHPAEDGRVGDLVAVEMQDRQHGAVTAPDRGTYWSARTRRAVRSRPRRRRRRRRRSDPGLSNAAP